MKRGQIDISFGMIFSIILIIVFVALAIYAIVMFLNLQKCASTGLFKDDLQGEVTRAWGSDEMSFTKDFSLPGQITEVCFVNASEAYKGEFKQEYDSFQRYASRGYNMLFYPTEKTCEGQTGFAIDNIDIDKITASKNPYCIKNNYGKIIISISGYYGKLVVLS